MDRQWITQYSHHLNRDMHILVHGQGGVPFMAFPCQNSMCTNYEEFGMIDTISDYLDQGKIQFFTVDTVDRESFSDKYGDKEHRAWMQECYYRYIIEEALPLVGQINGTGMLPVTFGCSLGATHASIAFLRRPDLLGGMLCLSGLYDSTWFWDGWCNDILYDNSPAVFLANMPADHPYIDIYNQRKIVICAGQGPWEDAGLPSVYAMRDIFTAKGIHAWVDLWGHDVSHDWPWWKKEMRYFLPHFI